VSATNNERTVQKKGTIAIIQEKPKKGQGIEGGAKKGNVTEGKGGKKQQRGKHREMTRKGELNIVEIRDMKKVVQASRG